MTTYEIVNLYIKEMSISLAEGSLNNYRSILTDFARTCKKDADKMELVNYIAEKRAEGNSNNTIRTKLAVIKGFIAWGHVNGFYESDFAQNIKLPNAEYHIAERMNKDEVTAMLHEPAPKGTHNAVRNRAILELAIVTASRASAICNIRLSDVDFERRTITLKHTKRNKDIEHAMTDSLADILEEYINTERPEELSDDDYLFVGERKDRTGNYRPLSRQQIFNISKRYTENACGKALSPHKLRHTSASIQLESGTLSIDEISKNLGHASIATTQRYAQRLNDENRKNATASVFEGI